MFGRALIVLVAAALLWAVLVRDTGAGGNPRFHTVRHGETLWSIAAQSYGGDPRRGVYLLEQRNHLAGTTIVPGQHLMLP